MKFGEKLRQRRKELKLKQEDLARLIGVSKRTVINYEAGNSYPKSRDVYHKIAGALDIDVNYLLTEDEEFVLEANESFGSRGALEARRILERASAMFAGGDLDDDDKLAFVHQIQELYLDSKRISKKYAPNKRKRNGSEMI